MENVLREPIELTAFELDLVAGGDPFGSTAAALVAAASGTVNNIGNIVGQANGLVAATIANTGLIVG